MIILHLNHHQVKPIQNQVILPFMKELSTHGFENIYCDGLMIKNKSNLGKLVFFIFSIKLFFEKALKNIVTFWDFHFFNILERIPILSAGIILKTIEKKPDVIILYWISGSFNVKTIYNLQKKTGAKVFWYFMDKAPVTGGCHYTWDCKQYATSGCNNCQAFKMPFLSFIAAANFKYRKKYLDKLDITAISPTAESIALITSSILFNQKEKVLIPIGVDKNKYSTKEINHLEFCGIKRESGITYFLAGANNVNDKRKGAQYFIDALCIIKEKNLQLFQTIEIIIIGAIKQNPFEEIGVRNKSIGYVNESGLINLYNFVDAYICPSIEDMGPLMVNQSLMCGTPVIAFNTGVAPDLIKNDDHGYLAKMYDVEDFTKGLIMILEKNKKFSTENKIQTREQMVNKVSTESAAVQLSKLL